MEGKRGYIRQPGMTDRWGREGYVFRLEQEGGEGRREGRREGAEYEGGEGHL